ncbi:MAG: response regulator transcription factor, partial [Thermoleophilaceae bacterium]
GGTFASAPSSPRTTGDRPGLYEPLTERDLGILRHLAEGDTNKEIARALMLAEDTVKKGVQAVIAKLGATDRTHAVVVALRTGLIE